MANYVISDIHGCFNTFIKLLEKINFSENDKLYILGDIIDRGPDSYKIYTWVKERYNKNVFMVLGNHEDMFIENIDDIGKKKNEFNNLSANEKTKYFDNFFNVMAAWGEDHYGTIRNLLKDHSADEIIEMAEFFRELPWYLEVNCNDAIWTLVHAGCSLPLDKTSKDTFVWSRDLTFPGAGIKGKNIIFGHTPTICDEYNREGGIHYEEGIILKEKYIKINIDCGCVWNHKNSKLGILRLEDLQDFYIENCD